MAELSPPEPIPGLCHAPSSQLVIVDIQTRLAAVMPEEERRRCFTYTGLLLQAASQLRVPVSATEQYPDGLGGTDQAIATHFPEHAAIFSKTRFSCCGADGFEASLDRDSRPQIILAGMETHVCVLQTALDLKQRGFEVFLAADASASRNPNHRRNALQRLLQAGIVVSNSESVVFEWLRDARHQDFRAISAILKAL